MTRELSYDTGDSATDAHAALVTAALRGHANGWQAPVTKLTGSAVHLDGEAVSLVPEETGGTAPLVLRVQARRENRPNLLVAAKMAREAAVERGLIPSSPEAAEQLLEQLCAQPPDERPRFPLVQISGMNGSSQVSAAWCRSETPAFQDKGRSESPDEFFLVVQPAKKKKQKKEKTTAPKKAKTTASKRVKKASKKAKK